MNKIGQLFQDLLQGGSLVVVTAIFMTALSIWTPTPTDYAVDDLKACVRSQVAFLHKTQPKARPSERINQGFENCRHLIDRLYVATRKRDPGFGRQEMVDLLNDLKMKTFEELYLGDATDGH